MVYTLRKHIAMANQRDQDKRAISGWIHKDLKARLMLLANELDMPLSALIEKILEEQVHHYEKRHPTRKA